MSRGAARVALVGMAALAVACAAPPATPPPAAPVAPSAAPVAPAAELRFMTWNVKTNEFDAPDWAPIVAEQAPSRGRRTRWSSRSRS